MWRGISLANKCLLLFGVIVIAVVSSAMVVPWVRMDRLVEDAQREAASRELTIWLRAAPESRDDLRLGARFLEDVEAARYLEPETFNARWDGTTRVYTLTRRFEDGRVASIETRSVRAPGALVINLVILLAAAGIVSAVAIATFYFITHKMILLPVRDLKWTAEQISRGDKGVRSAIRTGDEFEELSRAFNEVLEKRLEVEEKLRRSNRALDVKVDELASANLALADAARIKGEFVANVSHELRTPLNSILGFADLLVEIAAREAEAGDDSTRLAQRRRYLEHIQSGGRNLLDLVDAMLDLAKLEAGRVELRIASVDPVDLCEGVLGLFEPIAKREGVAMSLEVSGTPGEIETDKGRVQQVVFNLLSNAIKFAPLGSDSPEVRLRVEPIADLEGGPSGGVRLSVIDNGPGIAPEDQTRVFGKFEQVDATETRGVEGAGLGLAIAKELAAVLQGEIVLESDVGAGSMFCLLLPATFDRDRDAEYRLEARFRADLAVQSRSDAPGS